MPVMLGPNSWIFQRLIDPRRLETRVGRIVAISGIAGIAAIVMLVSTIISGKFARLEQTEIATHVGRTRAMIESLREAVGSRARDYAAGLVGDTGYRALSSQSIAYDSMKAQQVNAIAYVTSGGEVRHGVYVDFESSSEDPSVSEALRRFVTSTDVLQHARRHPEFQTYARLADKLVVIGVAEVGRRHLPGEPLGLAFFGSALDAKHISRTLGLAAAYDFERMDRAESVEATGDVNRVAVSVPDFKGMPVARIRYDIKREIKTIGEDLLAFIAMVIVALLAMMIAVLNWRLDAIIVKPLTAIKDHLNRITTSGSLSKLPLTGRSDEIGSLETGLNEMTGRLDALQVRIENQAYEVGKSQNAIGVIHNVRNGLSPLNVILSRLHEHRHAAPREQVAMALGELAGAEASPERRRKLAAFLEAVVWRQDAQLDACRVQAREAGISLAAVLDVIETLADERPTESGVCDLTAVVASNLAVANDAGELPIAVEVGDSPRLPVEGNRVLLSQVVCNLLTNAKEAIGASGRGDGRISIAYGIVELEGRRTAALKIDDNGEGIDPALSSRLFENGYSTRMSKRGGLGLHWCANTLNAMGGRLTVESAGLGAGATATVYLPIVERATSEPTTGPSDLLAA